MHDFHYAAGKLYCEGVAIESLASKFGTPLYVYSQRTLTNHFRKLDAALAPLDHLICYAVKANSNLAVLRALANLGGGFDIVSEGELRRVIGAGGSPGKCAFAGVGKTESEIEFALRRGIYSFNVESEPELERIDRVAGRLKKVAPVAVRVNPNVDAGTHAKITTGTYENKFGIAGGLGIVYQPALASGGPDWWQKPEAKHILTPARYAATLVPLLKPLKLRILIEPGRFISGNAGILVTRTEYVKRTGRKNFVIVDAAMNDLIRPAFYDSYHEIVPLTLRNGPVIASDVVGPVCESGDFFAKNRPLPKVGEGDCVALMSAGAYGFVMASNYNTRALAAEVLVNGNKSAVVRERQKLPEIWGGERLPTWLKST